MGTPATLWCRHCKVGFALPTKVAPDRCPNEACGQGDNWWTPESPTPRVRYNLTVNDRRFLRSGKIQADD